MRRGRWFDNRPFPRFCQKLFAVSTGKGENHPPDDASRYPAWRTGSGIFPSAWSQRTSSRMVSAKGRQVKLTVDNDGEPIPPEHLGHLFEPFYRGDPGRSRAQGGAGLGLALVRAAAEAHGGSCRAANRAGGVTFTVALPGLQSGR